MEERKSENVGWVIGGMHDCEGYKYFQNEQIPSQPCLLNTAASAKNK